ncbi:MAG: alpha/beta hydrolase [Steroidobacteraceae bacterium]
MQAYIGPTVNSDRQERLAINQHLRGIASRLASLDPTDMTAVRSLLRGIATDTSLAPGVKALPAPDAPVAGMWLIPRDADPGRRLVYYHGLSFMAGDLATYGGFASRLAAATRAITFFVEYRLAPEHTYPVAHDDCRVALSWAQAHGPGSDVAAGCVLVGDSCGASLALACALDANRQGRPVAAVVLFSPFVDLSVSGDSWQRNEGRDPILTADLARGCATLYAPGIDPRDLRLSPVFDDLSSLPPLQIHASAADPMFDDATRLMSACNRAGVPVESHLWSDIAHVWYLFHDQLKQARHSINLTGSFVRRL